jgi:hypothetical protein
MQPFGTIFTTIFLYAAGPRLRNLQFETSAEVTSIVILRERRDRRISSTYKYKIHRFAQDD